MVSRKGGQVMLTNDQVMRCLDDIDEDQAENSDIGGDSDADDYLPIHHSTSSRVETPKQTRMDQASTSRAPCHDPINGATPVRPTRLLNLPDGSDNSDPDADDYLPIHHSTSSRVETRKRTRMDQASTSRAPWHDPVNGAAPFTRLLNLPDGSDDSDPDFNPNQEVVSDADSYVSEPSGSGSDDEARIRPRPIAVGQDSSDESDSSGDDDTGTYNWRRDGSAPNKFNSSIFNQPFGSKVCFDVKSPLTIFQAFFSLLVVSEIVTQSNLYASQRGTSLNMTVEELNALFGILIVMGFHQLPSLRNYWSENENFHVSRISRVMTLQRFLKLIRYIHLNDNETMEQRGTPLYDKLHKVRPLVTGLNRAYREAFNPSRYISVDESMVRFKGRHSMKQYMPMKPIKRGFKVWVAACAVTGYVLSFEVYTGKTGDDPTLNLGEKVVTNLCRYYEGLLYCIFFDNFFSSIRMMELLLERNLFGCGTIRATRKGYPKHILKEDKKMIQNEIDFAQCGDISVSKWRDRGKKCVSVVTNMHDPTKSEKVLRTNKEGNRDQVNCPESIAAYNIYMGGVDRFDQLHSCYNISWKSRRWWMKLFYYFLDSAIVNSYIVYKEEMKKRKLKVISHLTFRSELANELIGTFVSRKKKGPSPGAGKARKRNRSDGRPSSVHNTLRLSDVGSHLPIVGTRRRCAFCSTAKNQKRSTLQCKACNVALCKECFAPFHQSK